MLLDKSETYWKTTVLDICTYSNLGKNHCVSVCFYKTYSFTAYRSSYRKCSVKKGILKNFAKFTEKHLWQSVLLKKNLWHRCFPVSYETFLSTPFLQNTSGRVLLSLTLKRRLNHFAGKAYWGLKTTRGWRNLSSIFYRKSSLKN